eukprot:TRINITY_DN78494_c0_g1_i1.p2 TRINITY_DN78494_c0_g1~~TRINITY_DN78494_c0_g1_i1.p2  ORF type:complete len:100 (+),score=9.61 TRINITY_DN78494_c0_g1_i1:3-302(+)
MRLVPRRCSPMSCAATGVTQARWSVVIFFAVFASKATRANCATSEAGAVTFDPFGPFQRLWLTFIVMVEAPRRERMRVGVAAARLHSFAIALAAANPSW